MTSFRPASFFERYQICRTENKYYSNFNVTAEYPFEITKEKLSQALSNIISKNPILACNFFGTKNEHDFKDYVLKSIPITYDSIVETTEYDIEPKFFEFLNSIYFEMNCSEPLWKLFIKGNRITLCCNHGFFDGNSGVFFHKDLLAEFEQLGNDVEFKEVLNSGDEVISLPDSVDDVCPLYKPSLWFTISTLGVFLTPKWIQNLFSRSSYPVFQSDRPVQPRQHVSYRIIKVSADQLDNIISFTHSCSTKFTPWFLTKTLETFQTLYPDKAMKTTTPLNGRRYYPLDKYQVAVATSEMTIQPISNPIQTMRNITDSLYRDLETRNPFYMAGMLKYINIGDYFKSKIGVYSRATIEVSNIGKLPIPCWFSQDNGLSAYVQFSVISSPEGMNIVVGAVDIDIDSYVERLTKHLDEFK